MSNTAAPAGPTETPILPAHIERTLEAIAKLHANHLRGATPTERVLRQVTKVAAKPSFLAILTGLLAVWIFGNLAARALGYPPLDEPPFPWLDGAVSIGALYMTIMILSTQSREDQLSSLREQLALELAILSEQKTAKTIQLLEELRRDAPSIPNRIDAEAQEMARPADPDSVLEAIRDTQAETERLDVQGSSTSPQA